MMAQGSPNGEMRLGELIPTHFAAASNDIDDLARLVREGSPLIDPKSKETPLHAAAQTGANETLTWLLVNKKASPLDTSQSGSTAAHLAVVYGHLEALKLIINYDSKISTAVAMATDEGGLSILSLATLQGDLKMVKWIADNYPQVTEVTNTTGDLAVHYAAASGFLDILKYLVGKFGPELAERKDKQDTQPVFFAAQEGRIHVLEYLVNDVGVDPVARDAQGMTTVHTATQGCQVEAVKWLIKKLGAKYIIDKTVDGATPLHMAAALGQCHILQFLLNNLKDKRDVNITDNIHATPAHDAAEYGQMEALLLLLRYGADLGIRDTENKTAYELALDQHHTELASMIADFRENGPETLTKYERRAQERNAHTKRSQRHGSTQGPRTSKHEAAELAEAIQQQSDMTHHREGRTGGRDYGRTSGYYGHPDEQAEIQHMVGPHGDTYAVPHKRKSRKGGHLHPDYGDGLASPTSSGSHTRLHKQTPFEHAFPLDDGGQAGYMEVESEFSRPSRVKKWHDSDSDTSSFASASKYRSGRHNIPGFYPKPYEHLMPPRVRGPRSSRSARSGRSGYSASSKHSSRFGRHHYYGGYPPPPHYGYGPYPPGMMPAYVGYAYPYQHGYRPKTTEERMHLAALQHSRPPMGIRLVHPGQGVHMGQGMHMGQGVPMGQGRRAAAMKKHGMKPAPPKPHTDADIGYGPATSTSPNALPSTDNVDFHPPPPPVSGKQKGGKANKPSGHESVRSYNANFILTKRSETAEARQAGDTTLHPSKDRPSTEYDGRWDQYIMTDSEDEEDTDDMYSVAYACEAVAILAIGCAAGLKGLKHSKKNKPSHVSELMGEKTHTWLDVKAATNKTKKGSREDPKHKGLIGQHRYWDGSTEMEAQELVIPFGGSDMDVAEQENGGMNRHSSAAVLEQLEQKVLTDSFAARDSSMLNIAGLGAASHMSLVSSAEEDDDDLKDEDAISVVHGISVASRSKEPKASHEQEPKDKQKKGKSKKKDKKDKKSKNGKHKPKEGESKSPAGVTPDSKEDRATKETPRKMVVKPSSPKEPSSPRVPEHRLVTASTPRQKVKGKGDQAVSRVERELGQSLPPPKEHTVSVSIPVGGPREVPNQFLLSQSDDEEEPAVGPETGNERDATLEQLEQSLKSWTDDLDKMLEETEGRQTSPQATPHKPTKPVRRAPSPPTHPKGPAKKPAAAKHYIIEADPMTEEIFSKEGLDELNDALRELSAIGQLGMSAYDDDTAPKGATQQSAFERKLLATLQALNETMRKLKTDPTVTQNEIYHQQEIQQQLIQNILTYAQNDPELTARLLTLLQQSKLDPSESSSSASTTQLLTHDLEQRLLAAQEQQFRETKEHFRTQEEFQQAIQRKLDEQADQQMKGFQASFEKYAKLLEQQLIEQRKSWEEELRRREEESRSQQAKERKHKSKDKKQRKGKKHKKYRHDSDSESASGSESDDEMVQPSKIRAPSTPGVKTMEAKILYTSPIKESDNESLPDAPPVPSVTDLLGKKSKMLTRRETKFELVRSEDALRKLEGDDEDDEDDEESMMVQQARPATVRRADIKYQPQQEGYTPHRNPGARQAVQERQTTVTFADSGSHGHTAQMRRVGAGGESHDEFHMIKHKPAKTIDVQDDTPEYDENQLKYGHSHVEPNAHKEPHVEGDPLAGAGGELAAALRLRQKQLQNKQ